MRLSYRENPRAGENFYLQVVDYVGTVFVHWTIDATVVNVTQCADPPCYEEMYIEPRYAGHILEIACMDDVETTELRFLIAGTSPSPVSSAAI
jgi:hypothetical protein